MPGTWLAIAVDAHADFIWTPAAQLESKSHDDELWQYYLDTAVHFDHSDLRGAVVPESQAVGEQPPFGPLHVVTAVQPDADPDSIESHTRIVILDDELRVAGTRFVRAVGTALDGTHAEESRAVFGLTDEEARRLGRRFGQVAVFAWHGPRWSLLACVGDRHCHRGWRWEPGAGREATPGARGADGRTETSE